MKRSRKIAGVMGITAVAIMLLTLSGCGSKEANEKSSSKDGNQVTIRFSWWGNNDRHKATLAAIKAFEKKNPNIKVKAEYSGWDGIVEKTATQIAGGTEADLMQMNYDWYTSYSPDGNGFYDLNKLKGSLDLSGYTKDQLKAGTINGKLNAIPHGENASVLAVNKTVFEKNNIDIPKTWEGYIEAAKKFPDGYYPLVNQGVFSLSMFYLSQKYGKALLDNEGNIQYTKDQIQEGLKFYSKLVNSGASPSLKTITEGVGTAHLSTVKDFIDGHFSGVFDWTGGLESFDSILAENNQKLQVVDFPVLEDAKTSGVIKKPTMLFSISKHTKHPKETAKLLDYILNDPEGVKLIGVSRGVPENTKAVEILEKNGQIKGISKEAYDYQRKVSGIQMSPYYEIASVQEAYSNVCQEYAMGKISSSEAAENMISKVKDAVTAVKNQ